MLIRHDPDVGHVFVPSVRARIPGEEGGYFVQTNASGFRSDFEYSKTQTSPRILMFGDSYTAGDDVANQDRYSDRLAALLGCEVQNYGVPGSGADQHLLVYRKFARDVATDLIVVCVQIDSFARIQASQRPILDRATGRLVLVPKPYFELRDGELLLRNVPVPLDRPDAPGDGQRTPGRREDRGYQRLLDLYHGIPGLRGLRNSRLMQDAGSQLVNAIYQWRRVHPYPDILSKDTPGWLLMEAILRRFTSEANPRPVMIVPIPTNEFYLRGVKPVYQELFATLDDPGSGVHVCDVSSMFGKLPWRIRKQTHYHLGSHFTPLGHRLVAEKMAEFIEQRKLLQPRAVAAPVPAPRAQKATTVLGISCFYHNSAAALIRDGEIVAACEEERFTRVKNDRRFPALAVNYCLEEAGIPQNDLAAIVYYDNAPLTFERICHSLAAIDPASAERMWMTLLPSWLRMKLHAPRLIRKFVHYDGPILSGIHHRSHAASCFYPSPFDRAAILTVDGVGEWATGAIGVGAGSRVRLLKETRFPHSLGLLYSAFTYFTGFKVNSGEYKMMGLAPYGSPRYVQQILDHLVDLKSDGSVELNLEYFAFLRGREMTNDAFARLFGGPRRKPEARITRREMDLARSIQEVTEEAILRMARTAHRLTGEENLCMAGGVALNCVANGRVLREGPFEDLWIQPAAGDSGCALGAAFDVYHSYFGNERPARVDGRPMQGGSYLGPQFSDSEIRSYLETFGYPYRYLPGEDRNRFLSECLAQGKVAGHFSGRLEYGPRSLGARSILGDPRNSTMQADLNLRIKYRESFRPFAPAVLAEAVGEYFDLDRESPYMLLVAPVRQARRIQLNGHVQSDGDDLLPVVRQLRSDVPAVTHVDYSARIQTIRREDHPAFYDLIREFRRQTGCAVLVNTSFNVRGEPIVCTPQDAYRCFARTDMDVLALGDFLLLKSEQPPWGEGRGQGLENEDIASEARETHPEPFLKTIRRLFPGFLSVAAGLRERKLILVDETFRRVPSLWVDAEESLPEPMNEAQDASRFATALIKPWLSQPAAQALHPLLTKLVDAGLRYPVEEEEEESVSESIYVMF